MVRLVVYWHPAVMNRKNNPIRLLLADDHAILRAGLRRLFALEPDIEVVAEASCFLDVLECQRHHDIDVVLLDINMPGCQGVELIRRIVATGSAPPILVLSMHIDPSIVRQALNAGAAGYLGKDCTPEMLLVAVRKVAAGGRAIDLKLAERLIFEESSSQPRHQQLSRRELDVMLRLAKGKAVTEIAGELSISPKTVSTHKARVIEKMDFSSGADLVRYVVAHQLID